MSLTSDYIERDDEPTPRVKTSWGYYYDDDEYELHRALFNTDAEIDKHLEGECNCVDRDY